MVLGIGRRGGPVDVDIEDDVDIIGDDIENCGACVLLTIGSGTEIAALGSEVGGFSFRERAFILWLTTSSEFSHSVNVSSILVIRLLQSTDLWSHLFPSERRFVQRGFLRALILSEPG